MASVCMKLWHEFVRPLILLPVMESVYCIREELEADRVDTLFIVVSSTMLKSGPDSVGIFVISHSYSGVVARACGLASLEPTKIAEILKDRTAWFQDC
ncbi:hypothetical protein KY285_035851 [Solanum tuberosum]|nr:hypothetical protein KY285_035851 [Solanum tuberosum]